VILAVLATFRTRSSGFASLGWVGSTTGWVGSSVTCVVGTWVGGGTSVGGGASVATGPAQAVNSHAITTMMLMINHLLLMLFLRFYFTQVESVWDNPLFILSPHICKIFAKPLQEVEFV
jgi:hypothetical protein